MNFNEISKNYKVILINNKEQFQEALDNGKLVMILDKKIIKRNPQSNKSKKKTTKELLEDFKSDIVKIFKDEITKVNNRIDLVDKRINTLETNINNRINVVESNINNRIDLIDKRLDNLVKLNHLVE